MPDIIKESSKATCPLDLMPTSLIKEVLPHLASYITKIVSMAFSTGTFPSKLKSAILISLIKKPNLNCEILKNYRPASNLPFLSKVIEKVTASRLLEHMKENNLLHTLVKSIYTKNTPNLKKIATFGFCAFSDSTRSTEQHIKS